MAAKKRKVAKKKSAPKKRAAPKAHLIPRISARPMPSGRNLSMRMHMRRFMRLTNAPVCVRVKNEIAEANATDTRPRASR